DSVDVKDDSEFVENEIVDSSEVNVTQDKSKSDDDLNDVYVDNDSEFVADIPESADEEKADDAKVELAENEDKSSDDDEVWESKDEDTSQNDDADVWEEDDGISPEDNAEVWEDEKDYSDDESENKSSNPIRDKIKSFFKHDDSEEKMDKNPLFSGLRFTKDLGKNSDLEKEFEDSLKEDKSSDDKVDLGSDDDYIYVDHSHDDERFLEDEEEPIIFDTHEDIQDDADNLDDDSIIVDHSHDTVKKDSINEEMTSENVKKDDDSFNFKQEPINSDVDDIKFDSNVEDHPGVDDIKFDSDVGDHPGVDDVKVENIADDEVIEENNFDNPKENADKVDLGSDDDYIFVDHSTDEPIEESDDKENIVDEDSQQNIEERQNDTKSKMRHKLDSFIADVINNAESQLEPEEIETLRGEVIDEDIESSHKPAPEDEFVVEAEIVTDGEDLNIFNDVLPDLNNDVSINDDETESIEDYSDLKRPTPKTNFEDEELNIFNDDLPDMRNDVHDEATKIVDRAMDEFMEEVFSSNDSSNEKFTETIENDDTDIIENENSKINSDNRDDWSVGNDDVGINSDNRDDWSVGNDDVGINSDNRDDWSVGNDDEVNSNNPSDESINEDGVTFYQGSNDVKSKLRKNNLYYDDEKPRSVRDSIRGFKKDMQYINKSLKEIENPTKVDYVSVVDRTEEYNPEDYLNMPSDDDSQLIIDREEELTFAEKEEKRIERELMAESIEEDLTDDVIVNVNNKHVQEEIKDQTLEDIIQSANEDYKEIEKERYKNNNTLKSFDDKKLPGKRKLEDSIFDYVEVTDIGIHSSDELYKKPSSEVAKSINAIVDVEGPIHVNEVIKRVKDSCNIKRAGSTLKKTVNSAISESENSGDIIKIGDFLYDASNNNVVIRRRNKPNIDLISDEEISKNIELVLLHKQNMTTKQIAKETSRNFGFKSTSKKTADRINGVLDLMIANNKVKITNDVVELN
ncbi:MAG: DUF3320 domain-containing protein, partial [Methanobrevibacter sp.]|uniref:DUF3320 domain-containing protein n=1 Tax=Methanobrevibacter sp. TaxID=66852 RepID=UPI002E784A7F